MFFFVFFKFFNFFLYFYFSISFLDFCLIVFFVNLQGYSCIKHGVDETPLSHSCLSGVCGATPRMCDFFLVRLERRSLVSQWHLSESMPLIHGKKGATGTYTADDFSSY